MASSSSTSPSVISSASPLDNSRNADIQGSIADQRIEKAAELRRRREALKNHDPHEELQKYLEDPVADRAVYPTILAFWRVCVRLPLFVIYVLMIPIGLWVNTIPNTRTYCMRLPCYPRIFSSMRENVF